MLAICLCLFTSGWAPSGFADEQEEEINFDEAIPEADRRFADYGVGPVFSPPAFVSLKALVALELSYYKSLPDQPKAKALRNKILPLLEYAQSLLERAAPGPETIAYYTLVKRVVYSVWSEDKSRVAAYASELDDSAEPRGLRHIFRLSDEVLRGRGSGTLMEKRLRQLQRILMNPYNVWVPRPTTAENVPVGMRQAEKEADFLVYPGSRSDFVGQAELAKMSWPEIVALDVPEGHPAWYSRSTLARLGASVEARWRHLERLVEASLTAEIGEAYALARAKRVLFFEQLKTSATSPKANAVDAHGIGWKVKWGDEIQSEAIVNRLYVGLGGKITDLVYANGAGAEGVPEKADDGLVLVLPAAGARERGKDHCLPETAAELVRCLRESSYAYNLAPNIHATGVIDREFFDRVLAPKLPAGPARSAETWFAKLVGRHYVTFRESLVELQPGPALLRVGAPALSSVAASADRIARSLVLFNMWVANRDVKDANNKAYLMKQPAGMPVVAGATDGYGRVYLEAQHDMGHALGGIFAAGELNSLRGGDFIQRCALGTRICFKEGVLFLPKAWQAATFSDLAFMAEKIMALSAGDIEWAVRATNWPEFLIKAMVNKLQVRRAGIVAALGPGAIGLSEIPKVEPYSYSLILRSAELNALARELRLPAEKLRPLVEAHEGQTIDLVVRGELADCGRSVVMDLLQKELYPSGLTRRMSRLVDDQEDVGCGAEQGSWQHLLRR